MIDPDTPSRPSGAPAAPTRARLVLAIDCLLLLLALGALLIAATGGFSIGFAGTRISARTAWRPALIAAGLAVLRLWIAPRMPFLGSLDAWRIRARRLYRAAADDEVAAPTGRTVRRAAAACAGLCAVAAVLLFPQLRRMDSVPDLGDPLLSMWRAGWVLEQLKGDPRHLFDANIFYPEPLTLTYSDSMLLPGLTVAPLLAAGVHPVLAYNLLLISGFVLSGFAAYLLVERLTGSARAGFVAGIVFGFYPYHFEHYSHLELQMMQWMPVGLLALHRFIRTPGWGSAAVFALCAAAQLYSSMYYGVFFALYAIPIAIVLIVVRRPPIGRVLLFGGAAAMLALALALPLIRAYSESMKTKGERSRPEVAAYSATPADYLRAHSRSALYGTRMLPGRQPERALFPGVFPIAAAAIGLVPPLGVTRLAYLTGLVVAFDGSLGFNGLSYPRLYEWFSPIRGLRVPARFSVLVALSLAVLSGFGAKRLLAAPRSATGQHIVFAGLIATGVVNVWPNLPLVPVWPEPPPVYGALARQPRVVLAEFPLPANYAYNTPYMYFSLWHWAPMVNGYSGYWPPSYEEFQKGVVSFPEPAAIAMLRARGVTHVTVNCAFYRGGCEQLLARLDGMPEFRRVAEGRWQGQSVRLYELAR